MNGCPFQTAKFFVESKELQLLTSTRSTSTFCYSVSLLIAETNSCADDTALLASSSDTSAKSL